MSVQKSRRRYTKEFKYEAVKLVINREGSVTEIANNLGIYPTVLHRWVREYKEDPEYSFPGNGKLKTKDEEIRQLKKQLRYVTEERDILKDALAIFSKKKP